VIVGIAERAELASTAGARGHGGWEIAALGSSILIRGAPIALAIASPIAARAGT